MKKIVLALLMTAVLFSCQKEPQNNENEGGGTTTPSENENTKPEAGELTCAIPAQIELQTALQMEDNVAKVVWKSGDEIKVFAEGSADGSVYATANDNVSSAVFALNDGQTAVGDTKARYAYYPAAMVGENAVYNLEVFQGQDHFVSLSEYASRQQSLISQLPFYAKSEVGSSEFSFTNLYGALRVFFNDYQGNGIKITNVKLTAEDYITGKMTVASDGTVTLSGDSDAQKTISIDCGEGCHAYDQTNSIGLANSGAPFHFFLPIGDYTNLTFEFTDSEGRVFRKSTETTTVVSVTPGKIRTFPVLNLTIYYGQDNCIIVAPSATAAIDVTPRYTFDERLRRSAEDPEIEYAEGFSAPALSTAIEWQFVNNESEANNDKVFSDRTLSASDLSGNTLSVTAKNNRGNALVSIKNGEKIVWSYHIWVTKDIADEVYKIGSDSFSMMDRNLGASRKIGNTVDAGTARKNAYCMYGMLYQWGRKEPLPIYGVYGDNSSAGTGCREGAYVMFGTKNEAAKDYTVADCIQNPLMKIMSSKKLEEGDENYTVLSKSAKNGKLWGATTAIADGTPTTVKGNDFVKTVYDPCPEGYMVPQGYHFSGLVKQADDRNWWATKAFYDDKTSTSDARVDCAFYPLGGCVGSKVVTESGVTKTTTGGTYSRFWVANPYGETGWAAACFENKYASSAMKFTHTHASQTGAYSVRCLKIQ